MNEIEKALLREEAGEGEPRLLLRSGTRIDAGCWWKRRPVCLCVMEQELLILAVGKRRYVERVPLASCRGSHYCHATGAFVVEPEDLLEHSRFNVSPRDALALLKAMGIIDK